MQHIVGIDIATDPKKRYISYAGFNGTRVSLQWVADGNNTTGLIDDTKSAVRQGERALLALDAPLGWPASLATTLADHVAGQILEVPPDKMFRRATDDFIKEKINKRPLDVGADRIARTAHAALSLLNELSTYIQKPIPLAWEASYDSIAAIEVYPAATLMAHGKSASGYKGKDGQQVRGSILSWLTKFMDISPEHKKLLLSNDNALDSALCVLAGRDFLFGSCYIPTDLALAKKEGWIWVRRKD